MARLSSSLCFIRLLSMPTRSFSSSHSITDKTITVLGKTYQRDETSNVTSAILDKVARNLHYAVPHHPIKLLKERVLNKSGSSSQLDQFDSSHSSSTNGGGGAKKGSDENCVKLIGLPWEATPKDIIEFFGELSQYIEQHGIHMTLNAQNRATGRCYVQMVSVDSAQKATSQLHKRNLGRRYVEVFQCTGNEVTYALMDSAGGGARSAGYQNPYQSRGGGGAYKRKTSPGTTVKAKGLPYGINEDDIVDFFKNFDIDASNVEINYNQNGRQTGMAYINFPSSDEAQEAVQCLNHKYIGHRYVELSLATS